MGGQARTADGVTRWDQRLRGRAGWVGALALAMAALGWTSVHTALETSTPSKDGELADSPTELTLDFTTDVQLNLSRVTVEDGAGNTITLGELRYQSDDAQDQLVASFPASLPADHYTVRWTTAGPDGHALSGDFQFTVLPSAEQEPPAADSDSTGGLPAEATGEVPAAQESVNGEEQVDGVGLAESSNSPRDANASRGAAATRWLFYLGIIGTLGALAFHLVVLPQIARGGELQEVVEAATGTLWRIVGLSLVALVLSAPLRLWFQVLSFFPDDAPLGAFGTLATQGPWGHAWLVQLLACLFIGGGVMLSRPDGRRRAGWGVIVMGGLLLPLVPVMSGHAWGRSPLMIAAASDFIHVVAAGTWVGGLFCLVFAGLPALKRHGTTEGSGQPGLPGMVAAFSRVAVVSVALLALSGALNTWLHLDGLSQLWTTEWGRMLLIKLGVVAGVCGLGFYNWRYVRPALEETPRAGLLTGPAALELALGAIAIAATSFLVVRPLS
ncbi:MAG: copper resistance CopC/CopD family protein [Longimicrobiales bacterium]